jgi:ABC-type transport system, involved in lipoprotein release, permease component
MNLNKDLKQSGTRGVIGGNSRKLQKILVVAEVGLALILVIGAGLMIQTYISLRNVKLGFNPEKVLTMRTSLSDTKYPNPEQRLAFVQQTLERVQALPGVVAAGYTTVLPLTARGVSRGFTIEGQPPPAAGDMPLALIRVVSPDYLKTMEIPLHKGRYVDRTDGPSSHVGVINEAMAKKFWAEQDPIGRQFTLTGANPPPPITIVGIVGDEKATGIDADFRPAMYLSYPQFVQPNLVPSELAIRTTSDPTQLASLVREQIWAIDRDQPISNLKTMEEIVDAEVVQRRAYMWLLSIFAGLALLQAILGIYGVLSYMVAQQTNEIGILMALGANQRNILKRVLRQGVGLAVIGIAIGLFAAIGLTRFTSSLLYGVSATDPTTFVGTSLMILAVAAFACYIPARRATKVNPVTALRME